MQFFQSFIALCLMRADSIGQIYGTRSQIYKISIYRPKNAFNVGNPQGELPSINQIWVLRLHSLVWWEADEAALSTLQYSNQESINHSA